MAGVCSVLCTSHSPYLYSPPEAWEEAQAKRAAIGAIRDDAVVDTPQENRMKFDRCMAALETLRGQLEAARPDVLLVFGDDQGEQFGFDNFPALGIFIGEEFVGYKVSSSVGLPVRGMSRPRRPKTPETWTQVRGHPSLARYLMEGLVERRFDLSFSMEMPNKEDGMGHAFMRPSYYLRPAYDIPTVPFFVNCYYPPQPTGVRCYELGRAIRGLVDGWPEDIRVAVVGSGGLWHTPGAPDAFLNERFDRAILDAVGAGDARGMAERFDRENPVDLGDSIGSGAGTGMKGGLASGSGETRNWIAAAAVADGRPGTVVDYVPVHASPCGMAFAYWERP